MFIKEMTKSQLEFYIMQYEFVKKVLEENLEEYENTHKVTDETVDEYYNTCQGMCAEIKDCENYLEVLEATLEAKK